MTRTTIENKVLLLLREPNPPPTGADFSLAQIDSDINDAIPTFMGEIGFAPDVSEKYVSNTIVAGLDYALPADCAALARVEYQVGATGFPLKLLQKSFDEFDLYTADGAATTNVGPPAIYREPFGASPQTIRLWPQPNSGNVTAGDKIILYYTTYGTALANPNDTPNLPTHLHEAIVFRLLSDYWIRKQDMDQAAFFGARYQQFVRMGRKYVYDKNQQNIYSTSDVEETDGAVQSLSSSF